MMYTKIVTTQKSRVHVLYLEKETLSEKKKNESQENRKYNNWTVMILDINIW